MSKKTCFFIGKPEISELIYPQLAACVERYITQYGVTAFFVQQLTEFDNMACKAVRNAKWRHPKVTLTLVQTSSIDMSVETALFDDVLNLPREKDDVWFTCAVRGDLFMLGYCDFIIACVDKETQELLKRFVDTNFAKKRINIECLR